jgi:cysteinyl-tRNA synthetase
LAIQLYNTLTKQKEPFVPLEPGKVRMYNCGPTVYNFAHVGNFRSFLLADLLRRHLDYRGFEVRQVMNITDVGHLLADADSGVDKVEEEARKQKKDPYAIVAFYLEAFQRDVEMLNLRKAQHYPRATEHIPEMLALVERLVKSGYAYVAKGAVYFDVSKFPAYGRLSGNSIDALKAGARIEINPDKKQPWDFALWKQDPLHLMQWDSPWGRGFPGWHVECSAMAMKYLGETIDIHTGGEDNIFPHHECEIAQSEAATGRPFVKYWVHARHLLVEGEKMSKSVGNFYTIRDLLKMGYSGKTIRYLLMSTHYRQNANLTFDGLEAAKKTVDRINAFAQNLRDVTAEKPNPELVDVVKRARAQFVDSLDDDLNVSAALAAFFELMTAVNRMELGREGALAALGFVEEVDQILGILESAHVVLSDEVERLIRAREQARKDKDFARADAIRDQLKGMGIVLEDVQNGVRWKKATGPGGGTVSLR